MRLPALLLAALAITYPLAALILCVCVVVTYYAWIAWVTSEDPANAKDDE